MKRCLALLLFLIATAASVRAGQDNVRCLRSIGVQPLQRLQFALRSDSPARGYVLHQGGRGPIPLRLLKVTELRKAQGGSPSEVETQWMEVTAPDAAARYVYTNEGSSIDDFQSIRRDGTIVRFVDDADVLEAGRCAWAAP
jgi:hypothetical protein